jgi:serine carboxypeptidase-like clade 1
VPNTVEWLLCTDVIEYTHDVASMIDIHRALLRDGLRALVYSGDHDMCVPHTGSEAWYICIYIPIYIPIYIYIYI